MNKLSIFKSRMQNFRDLAKFSNNTKQAPFQDRFLEEKQLPFKHTWSMMAHMHDLRVWTIAYGAGNKNNLQRLQEIHRLNNEMWYNVSESIWRRVLIMIALWFFVTKI